MYHLVVAVLGIGLLVLVAAGGISYFPANLATRTETAERVVLGHRLILAAFDTFKIANKGASPTAVPIERMDKAIWLSEVSPFLSGEKPVAPENMDWVYGTNTSGERILCLATRPGEAISEGVFDGLVTAAKRSSDTMQVSTNCETIETITDFDGQAALVAATQ